MDLFRYYEGLNLCGGVFFGVKSSSGWLAALPQGGAWSSGQNLPPTMTIKKEAKATLLQAFQGEDSSATAFQNFMRAEICERRCENRIDWPV
jgi:hypothetical protein